MKYYCEHQNLSSEGQNKTKNTESIYSSIRYQASYDLSQSPVSSSEGVSPNPTQVSCPGHHHQPSQLTVITHNWKWLITGSGNFCHFPQFLHRFFVWKTSYFALFTYFSLKMESQFSDETEPLIMTTLQTFSPEVDFCPSCGALLPGLLDINSQ